MWPHDVPCGAYVHRFNYQKDEDAPKAYLNFEGVDSCFYVWLNGQYVGYSQVSHATSEFDVTSLIRAFFPVKFVFQIIDASVIAKIPLSIQQLKTSGSLPVLYQVMRRIQASFLVEKGCCCTEGILKFRRCGFLFLCVAERQLCRLQSGVPCDE